MHRCTIAPSGVPLAGRRPGGQGRGEGRQGATRVGRAGLGRCKDEARAGRAE